MRRNLTVIVLVLLAGVAFMSTPGGERANILTAALSESEAPNPNLSTDEMMAIVKAGDSLILDSRSHAEWAVGHIPGAIVLAPRPGQSASQYVSDIAEIERLTDGNKDSRIVLYCNGPRCGKSKRLSGELIAGGYTNVQRYQLGAPVWRALGNPMVIEPAGVRYVLPDVTAYWIDARDPDKFVNGSLSGVANLGNVVLGSVDTAKDERRVPMHDYNTRIVVFGDDGDQARQVAEELTRGAFHNVAYFDGTWTEFSAVAQGDDSLTVAAPAAAARSRLRSVVVHQVEE
jgi:rhodanese-related sulfurtransferase